VTTPAHWLAGARPRTLPAAVAPVLVGTAVAIWDGGAVWSRALLALVVALALQVGVNYANDYSDGVRGTDAQRVGPVRLVGQGLAEPTAVKRAALLAFAVAAVAGLALVVLSGLWWLLAVGAAAIVAAWTYTGGPRPYGYAGLGEVFVFVFFGLVAVCGTAVVQVGFISGLAWMCGIGVGALSCAILVANNLRDIPGDTASGKRTLAVRIGDPATRQMYTALVAVALAIPALIGTVGLLAPERWPAGAVLGLGALAAAAAPLRLVRAGVVGRDLIPVLVATGRLLLVYGVLLSVGIGAAALVG
jgi:1,4-dihydroxy-2-naphthoate octaprenyltransferase